MAQLDQWTPQLLVPLLCMPGRCNI